MSARGHCCVKVKPNGMSACVKVTDESGHAADVWVVTVVAARFVRSLQAINWHHQRRSRRDSLAGSTATTSATNKKKTIKRLKSCHAQILKADHFCICSSFHFQSLRGVQSLYRSQSILVTKHIYSTYEYTKCDTSIKLCVVEKQITYQTKAYAMRYNET